jgi:hypothetical protein
LDESETEEIGFGIGIVNWYSPIKEHRCPRKHLPLERSVDDDNEDVTNRS